LQEMKLKVLSIFGTRPEAVKLAPVLEKLKERPDRIVSKCCVTAQHRNMLDQVLNLFDIIPDYDLDLMNDNQSPATVASKVFELLEPFMAKEKPDWVLVQGDTTTVMAASLVAHYNRVKLGHVEAGLRSNDKYQPFPEEVNRKVVGVAADLHFAPTERSRKNLTDEKIPDHNIVVTGNTIVDALQLMKSKPYDVENGPLRNIPWEKRIILVTAHRRENFGRPFNEICDALKEIAGKLESIHLVYPVHPNPNIEKPAYERLNGDDNISLLPPVDYGTLIYLMSRSYFILTDSGGIQEEAPSFGKPVLVLRNKTERPEGIEKGIAKLVGTDRQRIVEETERLFGDTKLYKTMAGSENPYGDGHASERIVRALLDYT